MQAVILQFQKCRVIKHEINNLRFPGQYADSESGLHYNYFRDYNPSDGRYMQSDPIGLYGGFNTFAYVASDPINSIDPQGLYLFPQGGGPVCPPGDPACSSVMAEPPGEIQYICDLNEDCPSPVTINWTSGLPGARIRPTITKTYSGRCLLQFGIGFKATTFVLGTAVVETAPKQLSKRGFDKLANAASKGGESNFKVHQLV